MISLQARDRRVFLKSTLVSGQFWIEALEDRELAIKVRVRHHSLRPSSRASRRAEQGRSRRSTNLEHSLQRYLIRTDQGTLNRNQLQFSPPLKHIISKEWSIRSLLDQFKPTSNMLAGTTQSQNLWPIMHLRRELTLIINPSSGNNFNAWGPNKKTKGLIKLINLQIKQPAACLLQSSILTLLPITPIKQSIKTELRSINS